MSQLDNFRQVLKKENIGPDSNVDIPGNTAIKQKNEDESDKPKQTGRNRKTISREPRVKMKRTSIGLPGELHEKLKIVCLWMKKEGVKDNPGLVDVVNELLSFYLEKHPSAENLIKLFYNSK